MYQCDHYCLPPAVLHWRYPELAWTPFHLKIVSSRCSNHASLLVNKLFIFGLSGLIWMLIASCRNLVLGNKVSAPSKWKPPCWYIASSTNSEGSQLHRSEAMDEGPKLHKMQLNNKKQLNKTKNAIQEAAREGWGYCLFGTLAVAELLSTLYVPWGKNLALTGINGSR
jgi:hypothetical protein